MKDLYIFKTYLICSDEFSFKQDNTFAVISVAYSGGTLIVIKHYELVTNFKKRSVMKNLIYIFLVTTMIVACGESGSKKTAGNGGTVAVTPTSHQSNLCDELLPAQLAVTEYGLDRSRVYHDRFYDSQGQSYKFRTSQYNNNYSSQYGNNNFNSQQGHQQQGEFVNLYTREAVQCNRLYAIDSYVESRYGYPRVCADYRYDNYSGRYVHKYQDDTYVNYSQDHGAYIMPDNSQFNCRYNYQDQYYYGLFYSFQANYQTGVYGNYNFQAGGNGNFKDVLKGAVLFGIGAAIINSISK